jgi:hypothetical protein
MKQLNCFFKYLPAVMLLAGLSEGVSLYAQKFNASNDEYRPFAGWKKDNLTHEAFVHDFQTPPPGYGNVAFYWWLGDPLTKERLSWQLERLAQMGHGTTGLQINYAHSDKGGLSYGYSMPGDPPVFSDEWWKLVQWYMQETKKYDISISLSDYTLGIGQGWKWDEALLAYPEMVGHVLDCQIVDANAPTPDSNDIVSAEIINGKKYIVTTQKVASSIDPMHPKSGAAVVEKFFQPFEEYNPNEGGKGLNFFFSDELNFRVGGRLWNNYFAEEFRKQKGYDVRPELAALFADIGQRTAKVRLDYYDVLVQLSEENYFRPVYEWHQQRGMTYGCDHGGRGRDMMEFGDYFRTQRWNQGPGSDQPALGKDIIKAKVAASIAHLNNRPRVWLEGFYGSGWGTSSEQITDATFANFLMGYNLLSLHGLYYSTHAGWWEWAPPCNHWRMPYWKHFKTFMDAEQRLAYLMTQGNHVCDVAVWYPVAAAQAGIDGNKSQNLSFSMVETLYGNGIDVDFIDFESIDKAEIRNGRLNIAGESYRVLVLPHPKAIRHATLEKAVAFAQAGGIVVTLGELPQYTDRQGAGDPQVRKLAAQLPEKTRFQNPEDALKAIREAFVQDITVKGAKSPFYFVHRKITDSDVYAFYHLPKNAECTVRCSGKPEVWDVWTGKRKPLSVLEQSETVTRFRLNNAENELVVVAFSPGGKAVVKPGETVARRQNTVVLEGNWSSRIIPTLDNSFGDFRLPAKQGEMIGAEARQFQYTYSLKTNNSAEDISKLTKWHLQTYDFGVKFRQLGALPENISERTLRQLESELLKINSYPEKAVEIGGTSYAWKDYDFSWRYGVEGDAGHQGYHGLKENMYDEFIRLGKYATDGHLQTVRQPEPEGTRYYLWTTVLVPETSKTIKGLILTGGMKPAAAWLNGKPIDLSGSPVTLHAGANPLLLRYDSPGIGYFLIVSPDASFESGQHETTGTLAMRWFDTEINRLHAGISPFDVFAGKTVQCYYRFRTAPGTTQITVPSAAKTMILETINGNGTDRKVIALDNIASSSDLEKTVTIPSGKFISSGADVTLCIPAKGGEYGGSVFSIPVKFTCGDGEIPLGDWTEIPGLRTYSGGICYGKPFSVTTGDLQNSTKITLDLGRVVSSARVSVNGHEVGTRVAAPWTFEIKEFLHAGENKIEVEVYNTLGNHYLTIPTRYPGQTESGLMGAVKVIMEMDDNEKI